MFLCQSNAAIPDITDLDSVCRVCLRKEYLNEIFKYQDTTGDLHDLSVNMKLCSGIEINDKDSLPKNICDRCVQLLSSAFEFRTLCENSHRKLLDILKVKQESFAVEDDNVCGFENIEGSSSIHSNLSRRCGKDSTKFDCGNCPDSKPNVIISSHINHEDTSKVSFEQSLAYYGCLMCEKQFGGKLSLDMHMAAIHSNNDDIKCPGCSKDFQTKNCVREHKANGCLSAPPGKVSLCRPKSGVGFPTLELPPLLLCPHCPRLLATPGSLHKHQALHSTNKNYVCEICGKQFPRSDYLSIHAAIHGPREALLCDKCSYTAASRSSLAMHARTHSGERPYVCEACGYAAVNISNLNRHLRSHSKVKDYKCEECGKQYGYKSLLKDHLASVHQRLRQHKCQFCQETYTRRNGLLRHLHKKHPK